MDTDDQDPKFADEETKKKIVDLIKAGKAKVEPRFGEALANLMVNKGRAEGDWELTLVEVDGFWGQGEGTCISDGGGVEVSWGTKGAGFGTLTFFLQDGKLRCDNQMMGRDFIKRVLCKLVDEMQLQDEPPHEK
jgi:hypothetical protein